MNHGLMVQHCRIVAPERLSDRFLASGVLFQKEDPSLDGQVLLAYVLEISKPWFPSSKVLPTLLETLHTQHAQLNSKYDLGDQFELLLRNLNQQLNTISEQGETDWIGNLNGLILVASGNELHFSQTGHSPAYLLQKNRIRQITDDTSQEHEPHPLKTFANLASGYLQADDYLLISNHELYNEISLDALRRVMHNSTPAGACQSIVRELKKDRNLAVSSIILEIVTQADLETKRAPEITEIILEEEMQSAFKKFQKKAMPWVQLTKQHSATLGRASLKAAKKTGTLVKEKVAPHASTLLHKGAEQASHLKEHVSQQIAEHSTLESASALPVVEIIPPKAERQATNQKTPALALDSTNPRTLVSGQPIWQTILPRIRTWFADPKHTRQAALGVAIVLIAITIISAFSRRTPSSSPTSSSHIDTQLQQVSDLQKKAANAHKLNQDIEASHEVKQGEDIINGLSNLSDSQKKTADSLWQSLATLGDTLTNTTRLTAASTHYTFSTQSQQLIASLPFFYGFSSTGSGLLQTGQGESQVTEQTIALPDTTDSIISITGSTESDTAGYALTHKNKVYRIVQSGTNTNLRAIAPTSGDFAPGDAISTYNGNVYILDGKTGLLWKYASTGTSYNKGVSIVDNTKYDIKNSVSVAIDGSIYILKQDGSLLKFSAGQQDTSFKLSNIPTLSDPLIQPAQVITNENMDDIYILDTGISSATHSTAKILEFSKDGKFVRQYALPNSFLQVQAFDIDPQAKKLWILSGNQVSEFDI